jgi:hypothetical protein
MRLSAIYILSFLISACDDKEKSIQFPEGGYTYITDLANKDTTFYFYPLKDSISSRDSIKAAYYGDHFYHSFNEPNLSLKPSDKITFRLVYENSYIGYAAIVSLTEKEIKIKEVKTGLAAPYQDTKNLNELEQNHYGLLKRYFPIKDYKGKARTKSILDSIANIYPQLLDADYFRHLLNKSSAFGEEPFTYRMWSIPISKEKFRYFVVLINKSEYWKLRPYTFTCSGVSTHPDAYSLEANTPLKYQMANAYECQDDKSKFSEACKELIKYAKVDKSKEKWEEQLKRKLGI